MTTVHHHHSSLRWWFSGSSIMWKTKRFFFVVFACVMCSLLAMYVLYGTGDTHRHSHQFQFNTEVDVTQQMVVGDPAQNLPPAETHNKTDPRPNAERVSASKPLLRILVLTYKRAKSLERCLASLNAAEYDGERVAVEIHMDRGRDQKVHNETLHTARSFAFKHGHVQVYVRPRHGGVVGQWLSSWRVPRDNTSEIAVFIEDDITVSPYFARWLRRVHDKYDGYPGINGYTLQAETIRHAVGTDDSMMKGPPGQNAFLYPVVGSWGFSPVTGQWREFSRWYHKASQDPKFVPLVPGLKASGWYHEFHRTGRTETMWTMWHIYYATKNHQYTVYPHLPQRKGLAFNWKEPGEHYAKSLMGKGLRAHLLEEWREEDVRLPEKLVVIDAKGKITGQKLSPLGLE